MHTRCPNCGTAFRVTAAALRAAEGDVVCGVCDREFNALDHLGEGAAPAVNRDEDDPESAEFVAALESVVDAPEPEIAEDLAARPVAEFHDPLEDTFDQIEPDEAADTAQDPVDAIDDIPDSALEFRGSAADLDRLFVPADATRLRPLAPLATSTATPNARRDDNADSTAATEHAADSSDAAPASDRVVERDDWLLEADDEDDESLAETYPRVALTIAEAQDLEPVAEGVDLAADADARADGSPVPAQASGRFPGPMSASASAPAASEPGSPAAAAAALGPLAYTIPESMRRDREDSAADLGESPFGPSRTRGSPLVMASAAVLLLALAAQVVHHQRSTLAQHAVVGPWLGRLYAAVGLELAPPEDLDAFEVRQFGAASDGGAANQLRLRASLVNRAPFAQPYPLLRVALQDRFGAVIGQREFAAADYVPGGQPSRTLLPTGSRLDAEIVIVDPGPRAVGYEFSVCSRATGSLRCARGGARP